MLKRIMNAVAARWQRRYYYLSRTFKAEVPVHNVSWLPDGFAIETIANTSVRVVENFCRPEESVLLIDSVRALLEQSDDRDVIINDVSMSDQLCLNGRDGDDPALLPLLYRCSVLFGVPYTHVEKIVAGRISSTSESEVPARYAPTFLSGRKHSVLVFLNEVPGDAGGETLFAGLNLAVSPRVGRALCWSLSEHLRAADLGVQESVPLSQGVEKWFVQIWLRDSPLRMDVQGGVNPPQAIQGLALTGNEPAPAGVWAPQDIDLEAVFGQPDKMKGLL